MISVTNISRQSKIFAGLSILYAILTLLLPTSGIARPNHQLSDNEYHVLLFAVRVPFILIWCLSFIAYRYLNQYVKAIDDTNEGKSFAIINKGVGWIAWGFLVPPIITALLLALAGSSNDLYMVALVITNYMAVIVSVVAFYFIFKGAHRLVLTSKLTISARHIMAIVGTLVVFGVIYALLIDGRLDGNTLWNSYNAYYLPNILVWTTIVIPLLFAWFIGIFAALELALVARNTPGIIYKRALLLVAIGLIAAVVSLCLLQYIRTVIPRTGQLRIGFTLLMTYGIYALNALGATLIIIGARRLKRIEEI